MQIKCLAIKVPIDTKVPKPNFYRSITKLNGLSNKTEIFAREYFYWLDNFVSSQKQIQWLADIKTNVLRLIPEASFVEYSRESNYIDVSDKYFNLKSLQQAFTRKITNNKKSILSRLKDGGSLVEEPEDISLMPSLIPMAIGGKTEANMYKVLTQYATRLHYEKIFNFEYLYVASKIYNKNSEEKILPKKLLQISHKAFNFIDDEIKNNPDNFKQKLEPKELRRVRINHGLTVLQKSNKRKRDASTATVTAAIATGKYYKSDGVTLNAKAVSTATGISYKTVRTILNKLN